MLNTEPPIRPDDSLSLPRSDVDSSLREIFQLNTFGISQDFKNAFSRMLAKMDRSLINELNPSVEAGIILAQEFAASLHNFPTYREYLARKITENESLARMAGTTSDDLLERVVSMGAEHDIKQIDNVVHQIRAMEFKTGGTLRESLETNRKIIEDYFLCYKAALIILYKDSIEFEMQSRSLEERKRELLAGLDRLRKS